MKRPVATSRISASSSQLSHSLRTASTWSAASSKRSVTTSCTAGVSYSSNRIAGIVRRPKWAASFWRALTWTRRPARPVLT